MLSVVIPALNSASTISLTLSSIFSSDFPQESYEVLVVDNGSLDETVEVAKKYPVRVYHCTERGIGPPRNVGIKNAGGDIEQVTGRRCTLAAFPWRFMEGDGCMVRLVAIVED